MTPIDRTTRVWLPVAFAGTANRTGFSNLPEAQIEQLAGRLGRGSDAAVSPEPLGIRDVFAWQLQENLSSRGSALADNTGGALDDFKLLIEALCYGLLAPVTYDLANLAPPGQNNVFHFRFAHPSERYLTVLKYQPTPDTPGTVVGSFAPDTLVCRPGVWKDRPSLERQVQGIRYNAGPVARGLIHAFLDQHRVRSMLWQHALERMLEDLRPAADPGPTHQANIGPFLLRFAPGEPARLVFFPRYSHNHLTNLTRCVNADVTVEERRARFHIQGRSCAEMVLGTTGPDARLFGLGNMAIAPGVQPAALPVRTDIEGRARTDFIEAAQRVVGNYFEELSLGDRFRLPDSLRVGIEAWGHASAVQNFGGDQQNILFGPAFLRANLAPRPDQISSNPGPHRRDGTFMFVERLNGSRLAYYVEEHANVRVGELTALGFALWKIYGGIRWDAAREEAADHTTTYLQNQQGRLGTPADMTIAAPDPRRSADWSGFLHLVENETMPELFRHACKSFIEHSHLRAPAGPVPVQPIRIMHYDWWQLR
jgi:hypothetical protein